MSVILIIEKKSIKDKEGKIRNWILVGCPKCGFQRSISFEELQIILKGIGECEDEIYLENGGKGADMVIEFCKDAIIGIPYEELRKKYQLPR